MLSAVVVFHYFEFFFTNSPLVPVPGTQASWSKDTGTSLLFYYFLLKLFAYRRYFSFDGLLCITYQWYLLPGTLVPGTLVALHMISLFLHTYRGIRKKMSVEGPVKHVFDP